jgi:serine/threonine-protein kinase
MADVYLAQQVQLGRHVAVKVLKPELANDRIYLMRFEREARAAASLIHANIVQVYEVGQIDGLHFIAQEYVEGQNLRDWLARNGPPDLAHALSIMRQSAAALVKAGEQGIVHRDIKPENIMLTRAGEVKVADFGLARFSREGDAVDLTEVGITLGTPLYMSPEQVEGRPLDPRSDIYSLGVTCYHMLTGSPPFNGETALAVAVQHINRQPRPLEDLRPDLPTSLCRVVHQMLAKKTDQRFNSAQELLRELRRIQTEHLGDQWPEDLPGWDVGVPELSTLSCAHLTRQLDVLMKSEPRFRSSPRRILLLASVILAAMVMSGLVAHALVAEAPLLAPDSGSSIPHEPTALRQWMYASQVGTEEAWKSVVNYTPKNEYLVRRAQQQLARLYLREGTHDQAMALFQEFASLGKGDEEFRAFGLAGRCSLLSLQGKYQESSAELDALWPLRSQLRDEQMRQMLEYAMKRNRLKVGEASSQQWQQWLSEQFRSSD